jgi:hypothetical protein
VGGDPVELARCCEPDGFGVVVGENGTGHLGVDYIYLVALRSRRSGSRDLAVRLVSQGARHAYCRFDESKCLVASVLSKGGELFDRPCVRPNRLGFTNNHQS